MQKVTIHSAPEGGGKCIQPLNGEIKAGIKLETWECNDTRPQIFAFDTLNERLSVGDLCVDTEGGRTYQGVNLALASCNGTQTQSSKTEPNGNYIRPVGVGGFCVDIDGGYKGSGAVVHLWKCGTTPNQAWQFAPALDMTLEDSSWHHGHEIASFAAWRRRQALPDELHLQQPMHCLELPQAGRTNRPPATLLAVRQHH